MIPNTVTELATAPNLKVSMALQITTRMGRNQVDRIAHSTSNFYPGTAQSDGTVELPRATISQITGLPVPVPHVVNLTTPTKILHISVLKPIKVKVTVNSIVHELEVNRVLALDSPVTDIELANYSTDETVQVILSYLT